MKAQQALDLLSPIPSEAFCVKEFGNPDTQQCCSIGHLQRLASINPQNYSPYHCSDDMDHSIRRATRDYFYSLDLTGHIYGNLNSFAGVNNAPSELYPQDKPKERIVALLTDMIKAGF